MATVVFVVVYTKVKWGKHQISHVSVAALVTAECRQQRVLIILFHILINNDVSRIFQGLGMNSHSNFKRMRLQFANMASLIIDKPAHMYFFRHYRGATYCTLSQFFVFSMFHCHVWRERCIRSWWIERVEFLWRWQHSHAMAGGRFGIGWRPCFTIWGLYSVS